MKIAVDSQSVVSAWIASTTEPTQLSPLTGGAHTFSLKGFDTLQNPTAIKTRTWIVDLATHRPDGLVGVGGKYAGNDVYNATATNQSKTIKTRAGTTVSFTLRFENDGTDTDSYTIKGGGSAKGYTVTYYSGSTDFTTKVTGGTCVFSLAAGASKTITMRVRVGSKGLSSWSSLVKVTSGHDPTKVDAFKGVVKRT